MPNHKNRTNVKIVLPIIILVLLSNLFFLYYLKYDNQNLSLKEFTLFNIGNSLNLFFTLLIIIGITIFIIRKKIDQNLTLVISFTIILTVLLLAAAISIKVELANPNNYLLSHPMPEVITGTLFLLYQFLQFIFISILWLNLFGGKDLLILRAVVNSFILILILFLFAFLFLSTKKNKGRINVNSADSLKIAVVLGAAVWSNNLPSPSLAARAEKAAELFRKGYVGRVQFTGGNAPGELSEAEVAYNHIRYESIDTTKIFMEKNTTSTSEQIEFIKNHLLNKGSINDVIIVSDSYHLTRIKEICKFYNVNASVVASDLSFSFENNVYYKLRESVALIVFWFFAL